MKTAMPEAVLDAAALQSFLLEKTELNGTLHIGATADNGMADVIFWVSMLFQNGLANKNQWFRTVCALPEAGAFRNTARNCNLTLRSCMLAQH